MRLYFRKVQMSSIIKGLMNVISSKEAEIMIIELLIQSRNLLVVPTVSFEKDDTFILF
jgi:ribosome-binding factor A